jgi:hypothetical protein
MLEFVSIPKGDRDLVPEVDMSWDVDSDLDIYEFTDRYKQFLKGLTFTDEVIERVQVLTTEELNQLNKMREGKTRVVNDS